MPIDDFSKIAVNQPEELQKIIQSIDFQIKFNLFILLIECILAPMSAGFYKIFDLQANQQKGTMAVLFSYYNSPYTTRILGYVILLNAIKLAIYFGLN